MFQMTQHFPKLDWTILPEMAHFGHSPFRRRVMLLTLLFFIISLTSLVFSVPYRKSYRRIFKNESTPCIEKLWPTQQMPILKILHETRGPVILAILPVHRQIFIVYRVYKVYKLLMCCIFNEMICNI